VDDAMLRAAGPPDDAAKAAARVFGDHTRQRDRVGVELARTHLLYGEWLRRDQLQSALPREPIAELAV
jgi:hypothetical protein